jgi:mRNA interferase MazF
MKKGTIILCKFPFTDLSSNKRRPALVISKEENVKGDVIVAFISSVIPVNLEPPDFIIKSEFLDITGLKYTSIVKCDKIASLNRSIITGELGYLPSQFLETINIKIRNVLAI